MSQPIPLYQRAQLQFAHTKSKRLDFYLMALLSHISNVAR